MRMVPEAMNGGSGVKIVYSAMHGVGADFLDRAFKVVGLRPVVHVKKQRGSFPTPNFVLPVALNNHISYRNIIQFHDTYTKMKYLVAWQNGFSKVA